MPDYRRNWVPGGTYFFTVALLERKRDLLVVEIDRLREAVRRVKRRYPFEIVAWVVLPDHLHCIWTLPPGDADYATRWRLIKLLFVKSLPKGERLSTVRKRRHERGIWHRRYWEHTIRDERDLANHVDYVHWNPVKHGHVAKVAEWPFSTFHRYVENGIYARDWGGNSRISTDEACGESELR
ncbi:putative transposase [Nitrosomonas aestuarii]|uniref:Putative transposase n=1 Tax=Nitrosomonas aestuarii TaxID=52441 RepID=A0A1I4DAN7_9PROT|nr:transposase [Nitrosomonas aestuarii]SFK89186.1 putative transposase [Nitrosomonas aestuarii]